MNGLLVETSLSLLLPRESNHQCLDGRHVGLELSLTNPTHTHWTVAHLHSTAGVAEGWIIMDLFSRIIVIGSALPRSYYSAQQYKLSYAMAPEASALSEGENTPLSGRNKTVFNNLDRLYYIFDSRQHPADELS